MESVASGHLSGGSSPKHLQPFFSFYGAKAKLEANIYAQIHNPQFTCMRYVSCDFLTQERSAEGGICKPFHVPGSVLMKQLFYFTRTFSIQFL